MPWCKVCIPVVRGCFVKSYSCWWVIISKADLNGCDIIELKGELEYKLIN